MMETAYKPIDPDLDLPAEVDERLRRLEAAMSALSNTQLMEERVADRVVQRLKRSSPKSFSDSAAVVVDSNRPGVEAPLALPAAERDRPGRTLFELWNEVRTFARLLTDHRYAFSITCRFGPIIIAMAYLFGWFFIGSLPFVGWIFERVFDVVLAIILYKILSREVYRYRAMYPGR